LTETHVYSIIFKDNNVFAATANGICMSSDNCTSWTPIDSGLVTGLELNANSLILSGTKIYAATYGGVFVSTDNGISWILDNAGLPNSFNIPVFSFGTIGTRVLAGTWGGGIFIKNNNDTSWVSINTGLTNMAMFVNSILINGTNVFIGTYNGVFLTKISDTNWVAVNTGMTNTQINSLAFDDTYIYAGTEGGVWKRSMSDFTSGIQQYSCNDKISVYPNPSNDKVYLDYYNPNRGKLVFSLFDIYGKLLYCSNENTDQPGTIKKQIDISPYSSGIYLINVASGKSISTRKLIIQK